MRGVAIALCAVLLCPAAPAQAQQTSNAEMTRMFNADQAARSGPVVDWAVVGPEDARRRAATRALLEQGRLRTAEDFYHAAFVFQHGAAADDFLLAHTLAVTAAAKGHPKAPWIAAATLDRYLQNIGREQIYGTQYITPFDTMVTTQEPYDRALVPDQLRRELGVPTLAEQAARARAMDERARTIRPNAASPATAKGADGP